ncbi:glycosyltransferase [Bifidobacterium lemurum]|uniref:glycosyltransferase n=1 Tax=Bifidobacterium lemurum TaxID=1603886 RepID=UPI001D012F1F|nr:glycosyltransferase [Bifidobacterium lemurum]
MTQQQGWETINRLVFPIEDKDLVLPLYISTKSGESLDDGLERRTSIVSRSRLTLGAGAHITCSTFFNAFPAGYWRRWTNVRSVRFAVETQGIGSIRVFRSTARGLASPVAILKVDSPADSATYVADISIEGMLDGGFLWIEAQAGDCPLTLFNGEWQVESRHRTAPERSKLSIAITTFNRASYCLRQLRTIADESSLRERLDTVYCVDQGTDLVREQDGFPVLQKQLGRQLTYIQQKNLGGSGGFSRGMCETVKAGTSEYALLLDDDAISEPEAILRAVQFADYAKKPLIVGGGMLHLDNRTVLYSRGERFDPSTVMPAAAVGTVYNHDFAAHPLWQSPELHRLVNPEFNGWWLCLIPTKVIKEIGLSMPFFIKYDDVDYGLRAKEHGIPTVCLPGVAVWHQGWHDKDISRTWEEYFAQRNRWICALLHFRKPSKKFLFRMMYEDAHLGVKLLYSGMKLHHMALEDVLKGSDHLISIMPNQLAVVRQARNGFDDSTVIADPDMLPAAEHYFVGQTKFSLAQASMKEGAKVVLKAVLSHENGEKDARPQYAMAAQDAMWQNFTGIRSAAVTTSDGNGVTWLRRDSKLYRKGLWDCQRLAFRIYGLWGKLSRQYTDTPVSAMKVWEKIFREAQ